MNERQFYMQKRTKSFNDCFIATVLFLMGRDTKTYKKVKVKFTLEQATKAQMGSGEIAFLFL
jgi:hypothetical protein